MIIYVDVLIFSNIVIDYILLLLTCLIMKFQYRLFRLVIASIIGGFSSVYIFFQTNFPLYDAAFKIIIGLVMILICFGKNKRTVISFLIFLILSFCFNGLIMFLQNLKADIFVTKNLVSYINISPITLIILTIVFYLVIRFIQKFLFRKNCIDKVKVIVEVMTIKIEFTALVDSGHTLTDPLSDSQIIIVDCNIYNKYFCGAIDLSNRKRLIPVKTINEEALLGGIRCDKANIILDKREIALEKPIILASQKPLCESYNAIISYSAINTF